MFLNRDLWTEIAGKKEESKISFTEEKEVTPNQKIWNKTHPLTRIGGNIARNTATPDGDSKFFLCLPHPVTSTKKVF